MLESELNRLRDENIDLKKQVAEIAAVEERRKKAEQRAESLEEKVRHHLQLGGHMLTQQNVSQMDELIQERVSQKENELNATYDERMRNYEDRFVPPTAVLPPNAGAE